MEYKYCVIWFRTELTFSLPFFFFFFNQWRFLYKTSTFYYMDGYISLFLISASASIFFKNQIKQRDFIKP